MPKGGQSPDLRAQRSARKTARDIARGKAHLPSRITKGHQAAVKRLDDITKGKEYAAMTKQQRFDNWRPDNSKAFWKSYKDNL